MVAPGQTPGQDDAPADASRARPDKTQGPEGQMSGAGAGAVPGQKAPSSTPRGSRGTGAKRTLGRPKSGGKATKTTRKAGRWGGAAKRPAAKKAKRPTGQKTGSGRKNATTKTRKGGARRTTSKTPTKKRAGSGKAGGKRNR